MMIVMNVDVNLSECNAMPAKTLITGASTGIGATYADRFARRGHDLVLVARDTARMEALATRLRADTGVAIDILPADLTQDADIARVEARLREDGDIGILVNNAGAGLSGSFAEQISAEITRLITLNTTSLARLAHAAATRFARQGQGAIINIASVVGLVPEFGMSAYGATKAFAIFLSQGLAFELGPKGVFVQAVLPAATRTELWARAGADPAALPPMMDVNDLVDAALAGFDAGEAITIPALSDAAMWDAYQAARQAMLPDFSNTQPAARYRA
ncbi:SDR family oxidoreductase [Gemmobacter fulvus]|uniref:SDR family NAD(P)-dependent oxidoreductase n=1 Tax=Gemmobacter fulvus TaxID=2840474 RepID=UPI002796DFF7|nr:SDR family oxidoreductase [Gemmobacter fulvus]MDQ1850417.1 SDR family oxidoreductase [Gemmobacter fulvus]